MAISILKKRPKISKTQLAILSVFAIVATDIFGLTLVIPVMAVFSEYLGASKGLIGTLYSVYSGCALLSSLVLGRISDRYGRRNVFLYCGVGALGAFIGSSQSTTFVEFVVWRGIAGLFTGTMGNAFAYVSDIVPDSVKPIYMSYIQAVMSSCYVIGPLIGGGLAVFSIRAPFYAAAGIAAFGLAMTYFFVQEPDTLLRKIHSSGVTVRMGAVGVTGFDASVEKEGGKEALHHAPRTSSVADRRSRRSWLFSSGNRSACASSTNPHQSGGKYCMGEDDIEKARSVEHMKAHSVVSSGINGNIGHSNGNMSRDSANNSNGKSRSAREATMGKVAMRRRNIDSSSSSSGGSHESIASSGMETSSTNSKEESSSADSTRSNSGVGVDGVGRDVDSSAIAVTAAIVEQNNCTGSNRVDRAHSPSSSALCRIENQQDSLVTSSTANPIFFSTQCGVGREDADEDMEAAILETDSESSPLFCAEAPSPASSAHRPGLGTAGVDAGPDADAGTIALRGGDTAENERSSQSVSPLLTPITAWKRPSSVDRAGGGETESEARSTAVHYDSSEHGSKRFDEAKMASRKDRGAPWKCAPAVVIGGFGSFLNNATYTGTAVLVPLLLMEPKFGIIDADNSEEETSASGGSATDEMQQISLTLGYLLGMFGFVQAFGMIYLFPAVLHRIGMMFTGALGALIIGVTFCFLLAAEEITDLIPIYIGLSLGNALCRPVFPAFLGSLAPQGRTAEYINMNNTGSNLAATVAAQLTLLFIYNRDATILLTGALSILNFAMMFSYGIYKWHQSQSQRGPDGARLLTGRDHYLSLAAEAANSRDLYRTHGQNSDDLAYFLAFFAPGKHEDVFWDDLMHTLRNAARRKGLRKVLNLERGQALITDILVSALPEISFEDDGPAAEKGDTGAGGGDAVRTAAVGAKGREERTAEGGVLRSEQEPSQQQARRRRKVQSNSDEVSFGSMRVSIFEGLSRTGAGGMQHSSSYQSLLDADQFCGEDLKERDSFSPGLDEDGDYRSGYRDSSRVPLSSNSNRGREGSRRATYAGVQEYRGAEEEEEEEEDDEGDVTGGLVELYIHYRYDDLPVQLTDDSFRADRQQCQLGQDILVPGRT